MCVSYICPFCFRCVVCGLYIHTYTLFNGRHSHTCLRDCVVRVTFFFTYLSAHCVFVSKAPFHIRSDHGQVYVMDFDYWAKNWNLDDDLSF